MKTGDNTDPHVLHVLKQMQPGKASVSKPEMAVKAPQPAKKLRVKAPQRHANSQGWQSHLERLHLLRANFGLLSVMAVQPVMAMEPMMAVQPVMAIQPMMAVKPVMAVQPLLQVQMRLFGGSLPLLKEITAEELKKPEMAKRNPAGSRQAKAKGSMKKPPVMMAHYNSWVASCSFGLVKETKASSKAYIQARDGPTDKPYCLVNVSLPKGAE